MGKLQTCNLSYCLSKNFFGDDGQVKTLNILLLGNQKIYLNLDIIL